MRNLLTNLTQHQQTFQRPRHTSRNAWWMNCARGYHFKVKPWRKACAVTDWGQKLPEFQSGLLPRTQPACVRKSAGAGFYASGPNQKWAGDITYCVPGVQGEHGGSNEPRVCLEYWTGNSLLWYSAWLSDVAAGPWSLLPAHALRTFLPSLRTLCLTSVWCSLFISTVQ